MNFDRKNLKYALRQPMGKFNRLGQVHIEKGRRHIYINRGSNVLAVAHADSVQTYGGYNLNDRFLQCATIDNRLGLYIVLFHLPMLGINCDVLITDGEESGNSSARDFVPTKIYNWAFSFDRAGSDMVMYQYEDDETAELIEDYGFKVGFGSYSDISDLEHLGCKCFNFGCGMQNYHSKAAWADLHMLETNLKRFATFYSENAGDHLAHTETVRHSGRDNWYTSRWMQDYVSAVGRDSSRAGSAWRKTYDAKDFFWDESDGYTLRVEDGLEIESYGGREFAKCAGCGEHYVLSYLVEYGGAYYCDSCLDDEIRYPRKAARRATRECDSCGLEMRDDLLTTLWNGKVCAGCYEMLHPEVMGIG